MAPPRELRDERELALLSIVRRHGSSVMATARRYSATPEDAEDAYQRGLEILLTKAPTTDENELVPWLRTVIKHEAFALRRQRERHSPVSDDGELVDSGTAPGATHDQAERMERLHHGAEAIGRLKPQELRALLLKAEGYSYQEICEITGWTYTKVNRCLTEGRQAFSDRLEEIHAGAECERLAVHLSALADGEARPPRSHCCVRICARASPAALGCASTGPHRRAWRRCAAARARGGPRRRPSRSARAARGVGAAQGRGARRARQLGGRAGGRPEGRRGGRIGRGPGGWRHRGRTPSGRNHRPTPVPAEVRTVAETSRLPKRPRARNPRPSRPRQYPHRARAPAHSNPRSSIRSRPAAAAPVAAPAAAAGPAMAFAPGRSAPSAAAGAESSPPRPAGRAAVPPPR